jgi:hypothetical protein
MYHSTVLDDVLYGMLKKGTMLLEQQPWAWLARRDIWIKTADPGYRDRRNLLRKRFATPQTHKRIQYSESHPTSREMAVDSTAYGLGT